MICGMEIGLAIFGVLAFVRGRMTLSKSKVVVGAPARVIGLLALTPLPLALGAVLLYTAASGGMANPEQFAEDNQLTITLIEAGIVVAVAALVFGLGAACAITPEEAARRERGGRYADDADDDPRDRDDRDRYDRRGRERDEYDDRDDDRRGHRPWDR